MGLTLAANSNGPSCPLRESKPVAGTTLTSAPVSTITRGLYRIEEGGHCYGWSPRLSLASLLFPNHSQGSALASCLTVCAMVVAQLVYRGGGRLHFGPLPARWTAQNCASAKPHISAHSKSIGSFGYILDWNIYQLNVDVLNWGVTQEKVGQKSKTRRVVSD